MSEQKFTITIDGQEIKGNPGQTIMEVADQAGIYIPRLCFLKGLSPHGSCRVCVVNVNGRPQTSCTQPIANGMVIENDTEEIKQLRKDLIDMLFVEGNHFCPFCEKSGNCELQAVAYRLGITAPKYPYQFPKREIDASHEDIFLDLNRCILCARCIQTSRDIEGKAVFEFVNRGPEKKIAVNADAKLSNKDNADLVDKVVASCPVGTILKKRVGFAVPIGKRLYDKEPIGSDIEKK